MTFVGVPCYKLICPVISACLFKGKPNRKRALRAGISLAVAAAVILFAKCGEKPSQVDYKVINGRYSTSRTLQQSKSTQLHKSDC